ncbi:MAG TPA: HAMP domain-containing histidine kinase [Candidatus Intestinimonas merdavium]|uniref:histidine kinase n=1 Tax=Candidatus Intestinimonas merdavium TaxID=2838622 RepID=A0A9D1Z538_9FIRM|nr:HAMP domain-containing histidine kinase [Candidatus Intestinimonas merdavium]
MDSFSAVTLWEQTLSRGEELWEGDYTVYDEESDRSGLMIYLGEDQYVYSDPSQYVGQYNGYGYRGDSEGLGWAGSYRQGMDSRVETVTCTIQSGVQWPLTAEDYFQTDYADYQLFQEYLPAIAGVAAVTLLCALWCLWALCRSAGHRGEEEEIYLSAQDRIPLDLYLLLVGLLLTLLLSAGDSITYALNRTAPRLTPFVGLGLFTLAGSVLLLSLTKTLAVRWKAGHMFRNTVLWRLCSRFRRWTGEVAARWSVTGKPVKTFLLYLLGTAITTTTVVLVPVYQGYVLWRLCRWVRQWQAIRAGTERIVGGEPDFKIDTDKMYRDLREHAEQLNDLGAAIGSAVEERLRSERFKAELITNVSHDLKTPLTSIINYVDLLKKEEIQNPRAREYIAVLDRKSQRLKKLTEDLVEASKASTGSLTVVRERLGFTQLLDQALGEYQEKFEKSGLTPMLTTPNHELYVEADGRHLWRVLDNLLGNCVKYAMPGTRVYLDVKSWDGAVCLAVKNVSREPLNIPAEQLMERFVRGDVSRTTEGSGLGLSIARSLTELQGGAFRLDIDGDLFKAVVTFPEYQEAAALVEPPSEQR